MRADRVESAKVVRISLDEPLSATPVEDRFNHALLVVRSRGEVVGEVLLPAPGGELGVAAQRAAITGPLAERLSRQRLTHAFDRATRAAALDAAQPPPDPSVSVVVRKPDGAGRPYSNPDGLDALRTRPREVIAVGDGPGEHERGVAESTSEVIAFTDADCVADPAWLDGLGDEFADPLVMAVTGYVGPLEIETGAPSGFSRSCERTVHDWRSTAPIGGGEGNLIVRRRALEALGPVAGDDPGGFLERVCAAGYRVVATPARIVWRRHREHGHERSAMSRRRLRRARRAVGKSSLGSRPSAPGPPRVLAEESPPLSVALASYNRRESLARVLEGLAGQTYPSERFEAVVVIDGSTDGSVERVRGLDLPFAVRLVEQENRGLGASRNRGVQEASAPVVVFLDDDIVPEPGFLAAHARAHRVASKDHVALAYCPPVIEGRDFWSLSVRAWWEDLFRCKAEPGHAWTFADFSDGTASLPRAVFLASGGFDLDLKRRQDWELGLRLLERGVDFAYYPDARAWHHADLSLRAAMRNIRQEARGDVLLARKHPHVRAQLPLAGFAGEDDRGLAGLRLAAYRRPSASCAVAERALALVPVLDALALRGAWRRLVGMLRTNAYLLGMRDVLPSAEEFHEFLAPVASGDLVERVAVSLDREGDVRVPPAGAAELSLACEGTEFARVRPAERGETWDWALARERVVREALKPLVAGCPQLRPDAWED